MNIMNVTQNKIIILIIIILIIIGAYLIFFDETEFEINLGKLQVPDLNLKIGELNLDELNLSTFDLGNPLDSNLFPNIEVDTSLGANSKDINVSIPSISITGF